MKWRVLAGKMYQWICRGAACFSAADGSLLSFGYLPSGETPPAQGVGQDAKSVEEMYVSVGTSIARPYGRNISFLSHAFDNKNARHSADDRWSSLRKHGFASRLNNILWRNRVHRRRDEHCSSVWQRRCVPIYGFRYRKHPSFSVRRTRVSAPSPTIYVSSFGNSSQ